MSKPSAKFRSVDGIFLLDKPQGLSSNQALQRVRHLFKAAKAGHTGTLDPLATGVLPICLGEATKFGQPLLDADKVYFTRAKLGEKTDTGDSEGSTILARTIPQLGEQLLTDVISRFLGEISQTPPMYSAVKLKGQPLYKMAREGREVERDARLVTVRELSLLSWGEDFLELRVCCSKGTYIRTLVEDIGEALGCGAHVTVLRRESTAGFDLSQAHPLDQLQELAGQVSSSNWGPLDALLLPMDAAVTDLPIIYLDPVQSHSIMKGQMVKIQPGQNSGICRIRDDAGKFIGLGEIQDDQIKPQRLIRSD